MHELRGSRISPGSSSLPVELITPLACVQVRNAQGVWIATFARPGTNNGSWVLWNGDVRLASQLFTLPASWGVKFREDLLTGARMALPAGASVTADDVPVLLMQS